MKSGRVTPFFGPEGGDKREPRENSKVEVGKGG